MAAAVLALLAGCASGSGVHAAPTVEEATQNQALGEVRLELTRMELQFSAAQHIRYEGSRAEVAADFPSGFLPAYGSGLAFKAKRADGSLEFYGVTDRGPNGDGPSVSVPGNAAHMASKVFPAPSFAPSVGVIVVGKDGAKLESTMPLRTAAGKTISGLPIRSGAGSSGEAPLNDFYRFDAAKAGFDDNGLDPESVAFDRERGALWISDEYGPFIVRVNALTGVIEKKYAPGPSAKDLPTVLAQRRPNRGMESLTLAPDGMLHGILQSPIDPKDSAGRSLKAKVGSGAETDVRHAAGFIRWLRFDPRLETSQMYAYPVDGKLYERDRTGNAKLGDAVALSANKFVVIEQGARKADGQVVNWLMLVEIPTDATNIATADHQLEVSSMTGAPAGTADYSKVVPLRKTRLLDLNALGWAAEKAEGLALVDGKTLALINDNDFGVGTVLLDTAGKPVKGSVDDCVANTDGSFTSGCPAGTVSARITRGSDAERPMRLWLMQFAKDLSTFSVPR
jgi:Esterase-like activity of phytase